MQESEDIKDLIESSEFAHMLIEATLNMKYDEQVKYLQCLK